MYQLLYLHWGQIKGPDVLVVGTGTYRGKITRNRSCVAAMEEPYFIMKIPGSSFVNSQKEEKKYDY